MTRKPFDWITEESTLFLERGYLSKGENPQERIKTISNHAEKLLGIEGFADKFYDYMGKGWYSLSSPVWANYGKKRGLPVSCFGSYVGDNIESILYSQSEVGEMSKVGGGTSGYFGDIRGRGEPITDNGLAPGAVHFMSLFEEVVNNISQGSTRRGRFSPYLPIEHKDIEEFLEIGTEGFPIQDLTHAVTVSDQFMTDMVNGDAKKRKIWAKVIQRRGEIGYPYIMFTDTANKNAPEVYKDRDLTINNSNLCVAPWTEVHIKLNGHEMKMPIIGLDALFHLGGYQSLEVKSFNLSTGQIEYKEVLNSAQTSSKAKVMKITDTTSGKSITCTPDHKIYTTNRGYVMAKDLKEDDELLLG